MAAVFVSAGDILMQAGFALCASLITLIPAAFVFVLGQDYLEQGIIYSGLKE